MATITQKANQLDKLNDEFIELGITLTSNSYENFYDKVYSQSINLAKGKVTSRDIKKIIRNTPITTRPYLRQTFNMIVLSGVTNVVENPKVAPEDKKMLNPILLLLAIYGVNKPKTLSKKVQKFITVFTTGNEKILNTREAKVYKNFKPYLTQNRKLASDLLKKNRVNINKIHNKIKANTSKIILKDLKTSINQRVIEATEVNGKTVEVKRPKTFQEIRTDLRVKFGEKLDSNVRRIVDTELHDLAENSKLNQHLLMGYTKKKWVTQQDRKVRDSHERLQSEKAIPIDSNFRVGASWGLYPGDPNLSAKERINCRCFLVYVR